MRYMLTRMMCVLSVAVVVNVGPSHGDIIVSNLNEAQNASGGVYASGPGQFYAQEFLTGSQGAMLGTVIVPLGNAVDNPTPTAELVTDNEGLPGSTVLATFTVPAIPTGTGNFADVTLTPNANPMLSANTDYWLVLGITQSPPSTSYYRWGYTNATSPSLPAYAASPDRGTTWNIGSGGPFLIQVNSASAVPEPSSLALIALGLPVAYGVGVRWKARRGRRAGR